LAVGKKFDTIPPDEPPAQQAPPLTQAMAGTPCWGAGIVVEAHVAPPSLVVRTSPGCPGASKPVPPEAEQADVDQHDTDHRSHTWFVGGVTEWSAQVVPPSVLVAI
jgi:hypothetical protein